MSAPLQANAPIVDQGGRPTRSLIAYLQNLLSGVIPRTTYPAAALLAMTPQPGWTSFCSDSNSQTFGAPLAGGGTYCVPVYADEASAWRVG
jgi:hypothetical protein